MAWKEVSVMSQRLELVQLAVAEGANVSKLCRRFGVSRQTVYKWIGRFNAGGVDALVDRSRRPSRSPTRTDAAIEASAIAIRRKHPTWGGRKIRARLVHLSGGKQVVPMAVPGLPAISTFTGILHRHGVDRH
jgi:hypothetical protein